DPPAAGEVVPPASPPPVTPAVPEAAATPLPKAADPQVARRERRQKRLAGIGLLAGGGALLAAGIALTVVGAVQKTNIEQASEKGAVFDPGQESLGRAASVSGPVLLGFGAIAAAAGGVLFYLGKRDEPKAASLAPSLMIMPGRAALSL